MAYLTADEVNELSNALVAAGLVTADARDSLLIGVNRGFVVQLPERSNTFDQLRSDMQVMNETTQLEGGQIPLQIWLRNAVNRLAQSGRPERAIFQAALERVEAQALTPQAPSPTRTPVPAASTSAPIREEEITQMDIELDPAEIGQFQEALRKAFNRGELEQVVFFGLQMQLDDIVAAGPYNSEVHDLVMWVNNQNEVMALLKEARKQNPRNTRLRKFEEDIVAKYAPGPTPFEEPAPSNRDEGIDSELKQELVDELAVLPVTGTFTGRTSLLAGIPGADALSRDTNIKRLDLDLIVTGLAALGPLDNGEPSLVMLIDNALPYASGFVRAEKLKRIRQQLLAE